MNDQSEEQSDVYPNDQPKSYGAAHWHRKFYEAEARADALTAKLARVEAVADKWKQQGMGDLVSDYNMGGARCACSVLAALAYPAPRG